MRANGGRDALRGQSLLLATVIGEICCMLVSRGDHALFVGKQDTRALTHRPEIISDPARHALFEPGVGRLILDPAVGEAKCGAVAFDAKANIPTNRDFPELKLAVGYLELEH